MKTFALLTLVLASTGWAGPRVAVVVGQNRGLSGETPLRHAERDARKVAKALVELGGFSAPHVHTVLGGGPQEVRALLEGLAAQKLEPELLVFYFSGHGDAEGLHVGDARLGYPALRSQLGAAGAQVTVSLIDACGSGALTRLKGARPGPEFSVDAVRALEVEGQVVIAAASPDEAAQESDRLEGSFFTWYFVSGLYGTADADHDGRVTLDEAFRYARFKTVERTIGSKAGVQRPELKVALQGQGSVVLASLSQSSARLKVAAGQGQGEWFVLDGDKQLVLTELPGGVGELAVPPGTYQVRKREAALAREAKVTLAAGETRVLEDAQLVAVQYETLVPKGGFELRHALGVSFGVRTPLVDGMSLGGDLRGRWRIGLGELGYLEPQLGLTLSTLLDGLLYRQLEIAGGLGGGLWWRGERVDVSLGLAAGLTVFSRARLSTGTSAVEGVVPVGLFAAVEAQLGVKLGAGFSLVVEAAPTAALVKHANRPLGVFGLRGAVGVRFSFE